MRISLYDIDKNKKNIVICLTAGDGGLDTTEAILNALETSDADIIQLGIPFSDPIAESSVIQNASVRSLKAGTTLVKTCKMLSKVSQNAKKPMVLRVYINTIVGYGKEKFFALCRECGITGIIIPDIPYEEREEVLDEAEACGVALIQTVTPFSNKRIEKISAVADGYLNCATAPDNHEKNVEFLKYTKEKSDVPCFMDCDFKDADDMASYKDYCDGFVISSAMVNTMADTKEAPKFILKIINEAVNALK